MVALGLTIGSWFATAVIGRLVTVASTYVEDHYKQSDMKAELQKLSASLELISSVVEQAERSTGDQDISPQLQTWLRQLKDAVYAAQDVLDELDYRRLKDSIKGRSLLYRPAKLSVHFCSRIARYDSMLDKLRGVVSSLKDVSKSCKLGNFATTSNQQHQEQAQQIWIKNRKTGYFPTESNVLGRDGEKEELMDWLMTPNISCDNGSNVSICSVVGHGGMGKTTLVRLVYNDETVKKFFDLRIWVCVSTTFDVTELTKAMLEHGSKARPMFEGLAMLQEALKEKLSSCQRYLLVLDDAWNDSRISDWYNLLAPIAHVPNEGKILLTTRKDPVAELAAEAAGGLKKVMRLEGLKADEYLSLFNGCAFSGVDSSSYGKLQSIGIQIAERLGGSPLLAKTIGRTLNSKLSNEHWDKILHSNALSVQDRGDEILPKLMLSYYHLPVHLRPCFAYCSIFPQDYMFDKDDLVLMWIALGLVRSSTEGDDQWDSPEYVGECYFDELVKESFLEPSHDAGGFYVMHDLLHELAGSVSGDECFRIERPVREIPEVVRYLYLKSDDPNELLKVVKCKKLRALFLFVDGNFPELDKVLDKIFKSLKCIRVLYVSVKGVKTLPPALGSLIHLRYLKLYDSFNQLPMTLCNLYHLQVITLEMRIYRFTVCGLPEGMNNLVSLRHLPHLWDKVDTIPRIGKLISLRELKLKVKPKTGYTIGELKNLRKLHELVVEGLENVKSENEAREADLCNKRHLHTLGLNWSSNESNASDIHSLLDKRVLDCLQPDLKKLKKLNINGYRGVSSASWMDDRLVNIEHIKLQNCSEWEHIGFLGNLQYLKYLHLENMHSTKQVDCDGGFPQLEVLEIRRLEKLEGLSPSISRNEQWCPCLLRLKVINCPTLSSLPPVPRNLKEFFLENVGFTALPALDTSSPTSSSSSSSLVHLCISRCEALSSVTDCFLQHYLGALELLEISCCKQLVDLPAQGFQHLDSLKVLRLWHCPKLNLVVPENANCLPSSLQELSIIESCDDSWRLLPLLCQSPLLSLSKLVLRGCNTKLVQTAHDIATSSSTDLDSRFAIGHIEIDDPFLLLSEPLRKLVSAKKLIILNCRHLESMNGAMEQWLLQNSGLEEIRITDACSLHFLPANLKTLSSLQYLGLSGARMLQSVPMMPSSLKLLDINGCQEKLQERCKDGGDDWPNIRHVPMIGITQRC